MKQILFGQGIVLTACFGFLCGDVSAKPWWSNPVLKYSENTGIAYSAADPHYMNKDENDQYLYMGMGSGGGTAFLYSIPALIAGTSSNDVAPIASMVCPSTAVWGSWKGGAVSDDLKIAITGNGNAGYSVRTTFPLSAPWVTNVTAFCSTNSPSNLAMDGCDFSHTSEFLFSSVYTSSGPNTNLITWSVGYVPGQGIKLTQAGVFRTSCSRIRCVNDYYIGGKDLVYYGEGNDLLGVVPRKVWVYDAVLSNETELVTLDRTGEAGKVGADLDIMNVKVGGVRSGKMHLYVQCNDGAIFIYNLNADGKSAGALVKSFHHADMVALFGVDFPRMRNIEFTDDEEYCFIVHKPYNSSSPPAPLHVLWTPPEMTATTWWQAPAFKFKENLNAAVPLCMNKDESDQFLFLPSGRSSSSDGYLYSIPALTAAATSNDVTPIVSGKPAATFQPGTVIYSEDFDGIETAGNTETMAALGWDLVELPGAPLDTAVGAHTAQYSIHNGKFVTDNLDETIHAASHDSYAVIRDSAFMKPFCTNDYSYQYDVTYKQASTNNFRYVSLLCNYTGSNVYNTVDVRIRGEGYNQFRYKIPNEWNLYNTGSWPLNATGTNSMMYLLYGVPYITPANNTVAYYSYSNVTLTVRVEMSMSNGPSVYVNGMLVSKQDQYQKYWDLLKANNDAYAICFKTSNKVKAEIDNLMVWTGCGVDPAWKGGAISDSKMRVLTAGAGTVSTSLPMSGPWTNTTVVGISKDAADNPAMLPMDALDFGHAGPNECLYSYSDYFNRTNNGTAMGYQQKIYKWNVTNNLASGSVGLTSNAVYTTSLKQLRSLDAYYIGGKDLVYYGEGQIGLAGATKVCVLDPATGTETVLINATTNAMPSNVMNVKVSGVGLGGRMYLYVQCADGSLDIYGLNADGLSVGELVKRFTAAEIKTLLGGVAFKTMRSFEVTNDGKNAFFTYDGADGLYVVGTRAQGLGTLLMVDR